MAVLLDAALLAIALPALAASAFLALETAAAFLPRRATCAPQRAQRVAVVIPAHDEEAGAALTVNDAKSQLRKEDRLIVVADNCADRTAEIARAAGAEVLVRNEPARRGKGYALQFAIDALRPDPPDVVCFFDADCRIGAGAVDALAAAGALRPSQCMYLLSPEGDRPEEAASAFAFLFMNRIRMSGLDRLFGVTRFTGTGMALPWSVAAELDLASGEIVEDLIMTIDAAKIGAPPRLVPDALVTSRLAARGEGAHAQRARWEHGSLRVAGRAPRLLLKALARGDAALAALAADIAIPPLGVLAAALVLIVCASALASLAGAGAAAPVALAALLILAGAVFTGWAAFGRETLPPGKLPGLALYLFGKLKVYGRRARETTRVWTRAARGPGQGPS
jgi:cellulose synthase/poly-beta-1,6-N-acetylglucosamine synthase-like glycosyltransferase